MSKFIHLRVHSEYSLIDGLAGVKAIISAARANSMPAVALTDHINLFALIKFYKAALSAGIKPICGVDLWLQNEEDAKQQPTRLTLLVSTPTGYKNLMEIVSRAYAEGQNIYEDKALVRKSWLQNNVEGLIALSGASQGDVGRALLENKLEYAKTLIQQWQALFQDRYYLEIQRTGRENEEALIRASVALANETALPLIATNEVVFIKEDDFEAHEARVCINQSRVLIDPSRPKTYSNQQYFRTAEEMQALFTDLPAAIENTYVIAQRCNIDIQLGTYFLPEFPIPDGMTRDEYFRQVSWDGLEVRLEQKAQLEASNIADFRQEYQDRLTFELDIIIQMGFPGYFLIVMDFIQWAKDNGVPVGPGRGSGAGSLVAYALRITDLDPLKYDLLFERFLNPERVSMPDFDIDFCMDNRDRVIDYVADRYGRDAVSQIITYGTMAAKAVVRDVARVQGKPFGLADKLSKMIPFEVGITLEKAFEQEALLRDFLASSEEANDIWTMAQKLEGVTRNVGKHAGGVVIAPTKLTDFSATYCDAEGQGLVTQYDKNDVEEAGLVKFDFLGLRTLTIIDWALKTINETRARENLADLVIESIDLEDQKVFALLQRAETTAVFQLESSGMKELIKRLKPNRFEDIIALVALFRPGPLQSGMVDDFINRKHGRAPLAWPHPDYQLHSLQPVLEPTYGIILYQEQVMQIAQVMAGYSLGQADLLRRAMGKKKPEEMAKQRQFFLDGSQQSGIDIHLAGSIFDLVEKFAGYGFNKSHSAAYALVSYQTAWLKTYYPAQFMAAVLSSDMQNTDKVVTFIEECRTMKLKVNLPDVNFSSFMFTVNDQNEIVYGLGAVKGVGEGPVEAIMSARQSGGKYKDLFDFCARVGVKRLNKRVMEALVRSGALDALAPSRAILWEAIASALQTADQTAKNALTGMGDLFGSIQDDSLLDPYSSIKSVAEWSDKERLKGEKDTLGLYVTGHPIDEYKDELSRIISKSLVDIQPQRGKLYKIAGLVVDLNLKKTKKGDTLCILTLDDRTARIEITVFGDLYEQARHLILKDSILVVEGEIAPDEYSGGVRARAKAVMTLPQMRLAYAQAITVSTHLTNLTPNTLELLQSILEKFSFPNEGLDVLLHIQDQECEAELLLGQTWRVNPDDDLLLALKRLMPPNSVALSWK